MTEPQIVTYTMDLQHPDTGAGYTITLSASSEHSATTRARVTMVHRDRDVRWMDAVPIVTNRVPL